MASKSVLSIFKRIWLSSPAPFILVLAGLGATYLQYEQAGQSWLFWLFLALTILAFLLTTAAIGLKLLRERNYRRGVAHWMHDYKQRIDAIKDLRDDLAKYEKTKNLADSLAIKIRAVAVLPVEQNIGVMLNIGKKEDLQVGTRFIMYQIDSSVSDKRLIEQPLGLIEVTYVQAGNNCSHAVVVESFDQDFWDRAWIQLRQNKSIDPPKNIVAPYIPKEFEALSFDDLATARKYLSAVINSLTNV